MDILWNRAAHYIFILWFFLLLLSSSLFFSRLFSAIADWMSAIVPHMVLWLLSLCKLRMQVSNVLHAAHWKYRTQKITKNLSFVHHYTTLSGYIFATKAYIDDRKKNLLNSNISSTCSHSMVNFGPLGWDQFTSLGHHNKFHWVSGLDFVTSLTSFIGGQPHFAWCLSVSWAGTLYIHFLGLLPPNGILPGAKFTFRPSLAFSYICSITAWHSGLGFHPLGWPKTLSVLSVCLSIMLSNVRL